MSEIFCTFEKNINNMEIQELPDYKAYRSEIDKYLDEPLLEYVWIVANQFLPVVDEDGRSESHAPIIFTNRWIESNMTTEERYARFLEFFPNNTQEDIEQYYSKRPLLDTSFKETFFEKEEVLQTLKAFNIDLTKFWYLLLFIHDVVEDVCKNAPVHEPSQIDKVNELSEEISVATKILLEHDGRQSYKTQDAFTLSVLKASVDYYIQTYNDILNTSKTREERDAKLEALGLNGVIKSWHVLNYDEKVKLEKSHRTRVFTAMFQYFLEDKIADREFVKRSREKISTDKLLLISRLTHIVGIQGEDYFAQYTENGDQNRKLSNLLSRYRNEPLPHMIGTIYSGGF